MKVYGPYTRKDGRKHVVISDEDGLHTVSYPKFLMEQHLGRKLGPDETVDHQDRDFTNDSLGNLVIRPRKDHISLDSRRVRFKEEIKCVTCSKPLERTPSMVRTRKNRAGPFCRSCAGKYGTDVQNSRDVSHVPKQDQIEIEDYYLEKE